MAPAVVGVIEWIEAFQGCDFELLQSLWLAESVACAEHAASLGSGSTCQWKEHAPKPPTGVLGHDPHIPAGLLGHDP